MRGSIGLCCCSLQICRGWSLQCCSDGDYFRTTDDAGECDIEDNYWSPMCDMTLTPMLWREEDGIACQRGRRMRDCSSQLSVGKVHQSSGRSKRSERVASVGGRSANPVTIFTNTIDLPPGFLFDHRSDVIPIQSTSRRRRISLLLAFSRHFLNTSCVRKKVRGREGEPRIVSGRRRCRRVDDRRAGGSPCVLGLGFVFAPHMHISRGDRFRSICALAARMRGDH